MKILRDPMLLALSTLLLGWGVYQGMQPPQARPLTAADDTFSAERARHLLRELYPDRRPHVSGSPQNAALRDRIRSVLAQFGYTPEVQSIFHCRPQSASCSPVENLIARKAGATPGSAILLTAHYDSAWAGPGVADDGAGVAAVLEIARMASRQPEFSHDLIFLLSDGEEQGLIGADAFASHHSLFATVRAVINLDARGVSGPSTMFETGPGNRGIVRLLANSLDRPVANSVVWEVYRHMPNDTDFSVYRAHGLPGVNFAFTGGAAGYHSRIDDLDHLDTDSLQHHGQNAWSMLLALDQRNLERLPSSEDAVYVDLFGHSLLHYPASSSIGLAFALSVLVIVAIRRSFPRQLRLRQVLWSAFVLLLLLLALPASGWLLSWPLGRWVDIHPLEHPFPWLGRMTLITAAVWLIIRAAQVLADTASAGSVLAACWGLYVALAVGTAFYLPVAGYLAVVPLLGFSMGLILDGFRWSKTPRLAFAGFGGFLGAAYLGFYYFLQLDTVANFDLSALKMVPLVLPAVAVLPLLISYFEGRHGKSTFGNALLVLVLAGCAGQQFVPGYTADSPRDMTLMVWQDDRQPNSWLLLESVLGKPDPAYARNHDFVPVRLPGFDGTGRQVLARPIAPLELPEIALIRNTVVTTGETAKSRRHVLEIGIPAGVRLLAFDFPHKADLLSATVDGQLAWAGDKTGEKSPRSSSVVINHPHPGNHRLLFEAGGGDTIEATMIARYQLPENLMRPYLEDWPDDAQPAFLGPRVLQITHIKLGDE